MVWVLLTITSQKFAIFSSQIFIALASRHTKQYSRINIISYIADQYKAPTS